MQADIITLLLDHNLLQHVLTYISSLPSTLPGGEEARLQLIKDATSNLATLMLLRKGM